MKRYACSREGVVTSPHYLATQAGRDVLAAGGNAIEAALAVGSTLCVVYPHMSSLGGDGFFLVWDERGGVAGFDGAGAAGRCYGIDAYRSRGLSAIPQRGPLAANTVAGLVSAWGELYKFGRSRWAGGFEWRELLETARQYAADGFSCTAGQGDFLRSKLSELRHCDAFLKTFLVDGEPPEVGADFRQPALAESLRMLQTGGSDNFYRGELARRVAAGLRAVGSELQPEDFARYRCRRVAPLTVPYRGGMLVNMPPPTQGLASLIILALAERLDIATLDHLSADYVHVMAEASKCAFRLRDRYIADPEYTEVPVAELLAPDFLDRLAEEISMERAQPWGEGGEPADTVWFGVMDRQGRAVSAIQSIYFEYGSGVMAGDTGILWQNRGCSFSLRDGHVNVIRPGKRPRHTLNPAMYLEHDRARLVYGTMGGDGQPQTQAALATRALDYALPLAEVVDSPRWLLGRTWGDESVSLKLERRFGRQVYDELAARGHALEWVAGYSQLMGHAGVIRVGDDGRMEAAADPRGDGAAAGI